MPDSIAVSILPIIMHEQSITSGRSIGTTSICLNSPRAFRMLKISMDIIPATTIIEKTNKTT